MGKWNIGTQSFQANRFIFGRNTITIPIHIPTIIMTPGGVILIGGGDGASITTTTAIIANLPTLVHSRKFPRKEFGRTEKLVRIR